MTSRTSDSTTTIDAQHRALTGLAKIARYESDEKPLETLQRTADLARELTVARFSALVVVDGRDNVEGFVSSGLSADEERRLKSAPQGHGPLGSMRQDGHSVRIDDLASHGEAFGFPPKHPGMKTLLGLPIWANGDLRGALYVTDRSGGEPFSDSDDEALQVLALHAGRVIANRWY